MRRLKETGILGIILLAATTPENLMLWGLLLIVCVGMVIAADRIGDKEKAPGRAGTRTDAKAAKHTSEPGCDQYITARSKRQ